MGRQIDRWVLPVVDLGSAVINALPVTVSYHIADAGGLLTYLGWPAKRRAARANFGVALCADAAAPRVGRIARRSFRGYARMIVDALRLRTMPLERLRSWLEVTGLEHIDAALARGKGAILVAPHVGNWEPASNLAAFVPYRILAVVDEGLVSRAVASSRQRAGIALVPQSRAVRPALRALRQNEIVVLIADLVKDFRAAPVRLFGRNAHIAAGPAHLAVRTGAALVPVVSSRRPDNRCLITIEPPVVADPSSDPAVETRRLSQAIAGYFERVIRATPEQWYPYRPLWTD